MNYLFLNRNFALKLREKSLGRLCGIVFITFERNYQTFNKIQAKNSFSRHVGEQEYTNHTTLLKNQTATKYLPYMRFLSNFWCMIIFMRSVNFWYQQDSNS